jgi:hypothetical protein
MNLLKVFQLVRIEHYLWIFHRENDEDFNKCRLIVIRFLYCFLSFIFYLLLFISENVSILTFKWDEIQSLCDFLLLFLTQSNSIPIASMVYIIREKISSENDSVSMTQQQTNKKKPLSKMVQSSFDISYADQILLFHEYLHVSLLSLFHLKMIFLKCFS